jgi:N-acetylglucosaminyldiphosphoundecaprenol N-acetyl-beta-D-mannosaminyltransferase
MDQILRAPDHPDAIAVVDADSVADHDLLRALETELARGELVVQADYRVLAGEDSSVRTQLVAAGFLLFHRVRFSGRDRLGMPASLVGNGMLFSRSALESRPWSAFTGVEDLEYSIDLRLAGIRPRFAPAGIVSGPPPATSSGEVRQRLRWEGGRFHVVRTRLWDIVRSAVLKPDPGLLDAALDLATPPLGLLAMATATGCAAVGLAAATHLVPAWAVIPWAVALLAIPTFVVVGLRAAGAPKAVWSALLRAPLFLFWKLGAYASLARGFDPNRWERSDRVAASQARRVEIAGVPIDAVDMRTAVSMVVDAIGEGKLFQVSTINLDFMVRAQRDPEVRRVFRRTNLNLADGAPVVWLARLLGVRMPGRVAGADFVPALVRELAGAGARLFLLGGEGGVAEAAGRRMVELNPDLVVAGTYEPPRARVEDMDNAEILARIGAAAPDVLLVAFGHPKQERWIDLHRDQLPVSVAIGVGCVLDLTAGRSRRAPRWMQAAGLEWFYRLAQEPDRLFGRYLMDAAWLLPIAASALRARFAPRIEAEPT